MSYNNYFLQYIIFIMIILVNSCGIYSFTGASIPEEANTICVDYIKNEANLVEPNLSNTLTENLINKCLTETSLNLKDGEGDITFSGKIINYAVKPISIQNNETAAQNRLSIAIEIIYRNKLDESKNFKKTFIHYADFESQNNFSDIELELNQIIINNLVEDIFNQAFSNW